MAINLGSTAISNLKVGSTQVNKIYLGSTEVWSHQQPLPIPDYGYLYLYGYTVTQNSITNVTGGTVTISDEFMYEDVFLDSDGVSPIQVSVTGTDTGDPSDWEITAVDALSQTLWIDPFMLGCAVEMTAQSSPFSISFTAYIGGITIDKTTTNVRTLLSANEFANLTQNGNFLNLDSIPKNAVKKVIVGKLITATPNNFLNSCDNLEEVDMSLASSLTTIGNYFCSFTSTSLGAIAIPEGVASIGDYFISNSEFNSPISLPSTLTSIGERFCNLSYFSQPIILPAGLLSIGKNFLALLNWYSSYIDVGSLSPAIVQSDEDRPSLVYVSDSASGYSSGIKIKGANRAAWLAAFPNQASLPYPYVRNLVDYGS